MMGTRSNIDPSVVLPARARGYTKDKIAELLNKAGCWA
jgi:acetate kinase